MNLKSKRVFFSQQPNNKNGRKDQSVKETQIVGKERVIYIL